MGNRTIVEFNHDYAGEIERDPETFLSVLLAMLRGGSDVRIDEELHRFGVITTPTHHHSIRAEVVLTTETGREFHRSRF